MQKGTFISELIKKKQTKMDYLYSRKAVQIEEGL